MATNLPPPPKKKKKKSQNQINQFAMLYIDLILSNQF